MESHYVRHVEAEGYRGSACSWIVRFGRPRPCSRIASAGSMVAAFGGVEVAGSADRGAQGGQVDGSAPGAARGRVSMKVTSRMWVAGLTAAGITITKSPEDLS